MMHELAFSDRNLVEAAVGVAIVARPLPTRHFAAGRVPTSFSTLPGPERTGRLREIELAA